MEDKTLLHATSIVKLNFLGYEVSLKWNEVVLLLLEMLDSLGFEQLCIKLSIETFVYWRLNFKFMHLPHVCGYF